MNQLVVSVNLSVNRTCVGWVKPDAVGTELAAIGFAAASRRCNSTRPESTAWRTR